MTTVNLAYASESFVNSKAIHLVPPGLDSHSFFQGQIIKPLASMQALSALAKVVRGEWFSAKTAASSRAAMLDPVITSGDDILRFEGFSNCRSLYVRIDMLEDNFNIHTQERGCSNVDFNQLMSSKLAQYKGNSDVSLSVGSEGFSLIDGIDVFHEKKVNLPTSWIKGFSSVQSLLAQSTLAYTWNKKQIAYLLNQIPLRVNPRDSYYLNQKGDRPNVSTFPFPGAIKCVGIDRIRIFSSLLSSAHKLEIYSTSDCSHITWVSYNGEVRTTILFSPEVWRGFSAEGADLFTTEIQQSSLEQIWGYCDQIGSVSLAHLSSHFSHSTHEILAMLNRLSMKGLLGFDQTEKKWFHRKLPFADQEDDLPTRMKQAQEYAHAVRANGSSYTVGAKNRTYVVDPDNDKCSCYWCLRFGNSRGACSHLLAVKIYLNK